MVTSIQEQTKILVELQKIDGEIFHLKKELASFPQLQKEIEAEFEKKKTNLKAAEDALKTSQLKQKEKEIDLASKEEKIKKLQGQLYQLKTNKEYSAMEFEIKAIKADNSLVEEEILKLFDTVEESKKKVAHEKELLSGEDKKSKEAIQLLNKQKAEFESQLVVLEEKRKAYSPNVDSKLLAQYEKILKGRDGLAIVPLVGNACGGCHIGLPPQMINEIQLKDKWITCEECARIIYWVF